MLFKHQQQHCSAVAQPWPACFLLVVARRSLTASPMPRLCISAGTNGTRAAPWYEGCGVATRSPAASAVGCTVRSTCCTFGCVSAAAFARLPSCLPPLVGSLATTPFSAAPLITTRWCFSGVLVVSCGASGCAAGLRVTSGVLFCLPFARAPGSSHLSAYMSQDHAEQAAH